MKIYSVYDEEFIPYGQVLEGYDTGGLLEEMKKFPLPEEGTSYRTFIEAFEELSIFEEMSKRTYGGMPIQIGMCWGRNRKLNCLEYHRDSEVNVSDVDFILLLSKREEIRDGKLDTSKVKAFKVPAGVLVEVYATTLHFAPCQTGENDGFRVVVILPRGTNEPYKLEEIKTLEDKMLRARNKWLLAHPESKQARDNAYIGLTGKNISPTEE